MQIRPFRTDDTEAVVALSLRAWEPNFVEERKILGSELDDALHGRDWQAYQQGDVERVCASEGIRVWVADVDGAVAGFVAVELHADGRIGEIEMLAVDPDHQNRGIGTALTELAIGWIKEQGVPVAMVGTGGDDAHAAARRTYEKAGMLSLPVARYFKRL